MGVSWTGLIGGLMGFLLLASVGVEALLDPGENSRWVGLLPLAMAAVYVPAIWASALPVQRRQAVLRAVVIASIVLVAVSLPVFGMLLGIPLALPTALLAIAAGLVFQGRR
jgi:hypothetical protein